MCPCCNGYGLLLGRLGRRLWFRCRACGIEWNTEGDPTWEHDSVED
jgi:hypothetical protein